MSYIPRFLSVNLHEQLSLNIFIKAASGCESVCDRLMTLPHPPGVRSQDGNSLPWGREMRLGCEPWVLTAPRLPLTWGVGVGGDGPWHTVGPRTHPRGPLTPAGPLPFGPVSLPILV